MLTAPALARRDSRGNGGGPRAETAETMDATALAQGRARVAAALREPEAALPGTPSQREAVAAGALPDPAAAAASVRAVLRGTGRPLEPGLRRSFEESLGEDLGQVAVYSGAEAERSARLLHARAYTPGS